MIKQETHSKPKQRVRHNNKYFKFVKRCNDTLYLYQEEKDGWFTTFSNFDLGMVKQIDEDPHENKYALHYKR